MIIHHIKRVSLMASAKVAITIDKVLLTEVDRLVAEGRFPNRSQAIQAAVRDRLDRMRRTRLAEEAAKLDPAEERAIADEGHAGELNSWPVY
jgi:Arc/MetJ-type ribon-helix-helix transcriptional regulator